MNFVCKGKGGGQNFFHGGRGGQNFGKEGLGKN